MHRWRATVHGVNKELDTTERLTLFTSITAINIIAASNNVCMYYIHTHMLLIRVISTVCVSDGLTQK